MIIIDNGQIKKANYETKIIVFGPLRESLFFSVYLYMTFLDVSNIH